MVEAYKEFYVIIFLYEWHYFISKENSALKTYHGHPDWEVCLMQSWVLQGLKKA